MKTGLALLVSAKKEMTERLQAAELFDDLPELSDSVKPLLKSRIVSALTAPLKAEQSSPTEPFHNLSEASQIQLASWINSATTDVPKAIRSVANDLESSYRELQQITENLGRIPLDEALRPLLEKIHKIKRRDGASRCGRTPEGRRNQRTGTKT
jgi:hypothetical protein